MSRMKDHEVDVRREVSDIVGAIEELQKAELQAAHDAEDGKLFWLEYDEFRADINEDIALSAGRLVKLLRELGF